ncbi:hypothetical protein BTJ39_16685 [Izhakiella australiensis]|uniref:ASCH domain-containing protein n=1 Tax=Izhakiella australiensis TaxID=1926881 RepID=A0A1S8YJ20_9GAMM|nr:ASCH domain-containing protein [Izhakiella australiensis]OON38827.1 hypothetical protein BTJ39_16685 [Izhakiella australiensis]
MQYLEIVPRLIPAVRNGTKRHTIRWQEGAVRCGPLTYINQQDPSERLVVWVTEVKTMSLSQAADYLGMSAEWPDPIMLAGMREHYPAIELDSAVVIIHHLSPAATQARFDAGDV